jgi:hypothetical protein
MSEQHKQWIGIDVFRWQSTILDGALACSTPDCNDDYCGLVSLTVASACLSNGLPSASAIE